MFKRTLVGLVALFMLSSTALATPQCNPFTVAGSYVQQIQPYINQLRLGVDGTAYWFSSAAFDLILLGTSMPGIGSWTCLEDGTVLVTTVTTGYFQISPFGDVLQPGQQLDITIGANFRITQRLSVVDRDTLRVTHSIGTRVSLSNDPLGPGVVGRGACTPTGTPCNPAPYRRIRPQVTDIPADD
jgi:hypothetical protein